MEMETEQAAVIEKEFSWTPICTSVSKEFHKLAKDHGIKWSDALRRGLALEFADRGLGDYDNKITIHGQLIEMQGQMGRLSDRFETIAQRMEKIEAKNGV